MRTRRWGWLLAAMVCTPTAWANDWNQDGVMLQSKPDADSYDAAAPGANGATLMRAPEQIKRPTVYRRSSASDGSAAPTPAYQQSSHPAPEGSWSTTYESAAQNDADGPGTFSLWTPEDLNNPGCDSGHCGPSFYARGEYLGWWVRGYKTPALVTTSPSSTPRSEAGVLGESGTTVLFGDERVNDDMRSGGRAVIGWRWDDGSQFELEAFGLGDAPTTFKETSSGSPILARPFFNLQTGNQDASIVAYPGVREGTIEVGATGHGRFMGAGAQVIKNLSCQNDGCFQQRVGLLYGFRYLHLGEQLSIDDTFTSIDPSGPVPVGTQFSTSDNFTTYNNFYGFNLGLLLERHYCQWDFSGSMRIALGGVNEQVDIKGSSSTTPPGGVTQYFNGGLLALPTNIGRYERGDFAAVPQVELKLGYNFSERLRLTVGYDFLYWSRVVRPGEQIDVNVNPSQASGGQLRGSSGPTFNFNESGVFVQGFSAGGEWRF